MIDLRDYQTELIQNARLKLRCVRRLLIQAPTGAGKTALATYMTDEAVNKGRVVYFVCHRVELLRGTSNTFRKFGIPHGFIAAGYPYNPKAMVQICSIDTLKSRLLTIPEPGLVLWDEAHHIGAAGWARVMQAWPKSFHVGLSATPQRRDGKGLDEYFEDIVLGPAVAWLIQKGYLAPYEMYAPHTPDMKGARKQMGEYAAADSEQRMDKPKITGDAIAHWQKYASGLRTVVFAVSVAHSQHVADQFNAAGIPAAHLDGNTPKPDRDRIIKAFAAGDILVLCNVGLFGEGFDLSAVAQTDVTVDCVMDLCPTRSLAAVMQRWGRALRPNPGKVAIILDHAGNVSRHGYPDDDREWSLAGKESTGRKAANDSGPPPPVTCGGCFRQIKHPVPEHCPTCRKCLRQEVAPPSVAEGELKLQTEADKKKNRQERAREQAEAKTLNDLAALGSQRGYKQPLKWAMKVFSGRRRAA